MGIRAILQRAVLLLAVVGGAACAHDLSIVATGSSAGCGATGGQCCTTGTACVGAGATCQSGTCVAGSTGDYGSCGQTFHECICACPQGDSNCTSACYTGNMDCQSCVANGQAACCPSEDADFTICAQNEQHPTDGGAPCTTNACINTRCASQLTAYNNCLAASGTRCDEYYTPCIGTAACQ